jgi:hypothetical protein
MADSNQYPTPHQHMPVFCLDSFRVDTDDSRRGRSVFVAVTDRQRRFGQKRIVEFTAIGYVKQITRERILTVFYGSSTRALPRKPTSI